MSSSKKKSGGSSKDEKSSLDFLTSGSSLGRRHTVGNTAGSSNRLPSVRPKRDLTLGGVPKKSYAPTIPTSRRIRKEPEHVEEPVAAKKKGRDEHRDRRDKGRRKGKEIITSASVFSMGPADRGHGRERSSFGGGGGAKEEDIRFAKKPSILTDVQNEDKPNFTQPPEDDFDPLQGASLENLFSNSKQPPTQLPLDYELHTKARVVMPKQLKPVKEDPMDFTEEGGEQEAAKQAVVAPPTEVKVHRTTVADLFTPEDPTKGQFLFLQLPDCLPAKKSLASETNGSPDSTPKTKGSGSDSKGTGETVDQTDRHCSLRDIPEGLVGKLRVHKSGKVRLTLGDISFDVAMGTPCGFLQELATVRNEKPEPKLTILGQLSHRLVCTPDFNSLLERT